MSKPIHKVGRKILSLRKRPDSIKNLTIDKGVLQLEKGQLEAELRNKQAVIDSKRAFLAERYLDGDGIEIGAAQLPVKLPSNAKAQYVDVFTEEELRKALSTYTKLDIVHVDVVDDGEKLTKFKNNSLDFIIANHFLEHCLDPIGTIINMYKKLRKNGVIYLGIPDKRYTFDIKRPLTTYDHLLDEHKDKTKQKYRKEHTLEYVRLGDEKNVTDVEKRAQEILDSGYRIHYHVWTQREMTELFARLSQDFNLDLEIEALLKNHHEVIYILRKQPPHKPIDYTPQM